METKAIIDISGRILAEQVRSVIRADRRSRVQVPLVLIFPIKGPNDIWVAARDEALKYLDIA